MESSPIAAEQRIELNLPEGQNYSCLKCGRGCEDFDDIRVDPATVERFGQLPVSELMQDDAGEAPYRKSPWSPGEFILRKREGPREASPCCFLTEDKLCALHCAHGAESKPLTCRNFPFGFTDTPGGVFVGISFACTAVLENHGEALTDQAAEVRRTYAISPHRISAPEEILLAPHLPVSWEQYCDIEADLSSILSCGDTKLGNALIAQSTYLRLLALFLRQTREAAGAGPDSGTELNDAPLEAFRKQMRGEASGREWDRLIRIAEKPKSSAMLRRVALGYVLAFREAIDTRHGRLVTSMLVLAAYFRAAAAAGSVELRRLETTVPYRKFRHVRFDPDRREFDALLRRFFGHCLFRKDLLRHDDVRFSHNMMLMNYGFIHWHGAAFAASEDRESVEQDDLIEAVRTVEEYFVFHSKFTRLFGEHPMLRGVMESIFHRPIFPYAMARPEGPK